jgi:hypothetical protein
MSNLIPYINNINNNNSFKPFDLMLDVILELLSEIKEEYARKEGLINKLNDISLNKEDYEKKIFVIKKQLIYKEKEIENLIKSKEKKDNYNSQQKLLSEINNVKKENQFLFEKIISYKSQCTKISSDYKMLTDKYKICLQEIDNKKEKNKKYYFKEEAINKFSFYIKSSFPSKTNNENENLNSFTQNNDILTDNNTSLKKLSNDLILFILGINKMLFKYDFALAKMNKNSNHKIPLNDIKDLGINIDINYLLNYHNYKLFSKYFLCNMDIIYNKIINLNNEKTINTTFMHDKNKKEFKKCSIDKKKVNGKTISLNNSRINQSINLFVPENKGNYTNFKSYISIKKNREKEKKKKMLKSSTSRNGFTFLNFYSDTDLDKNFIVKKDKNTIGKKYNTSINMNASKKIQNYTAHQHQNGGKSF